MLESEEAGPPTIAQAEENIEENVDALCAIREGVRWELLHLPPGKQWPELTLEDIDKMWDAAFPSCRKEPRRKINPKEEKSDEGKGEEAIFISHLSEAL